MKETDSDKYTLPKFGWKERIVHYILSIIRLWKVLVPLVVVIVFILLLKNSCQNAISDSAEVKTNQSTIIEGIYYSEYVGGEKSKPFSAKITRDSRIANHYLLSFQGQLYDFLYNETDGSLESPALGSGKIKVNNITNETIIEFAGWKFKH